LFTGKKKCDTHGGAACGQGTVVASLNVTRD